MERTSRSSLDRAHGRLGSVSLSCPPPLRESVLHVWFLDLKFDRESLAVQEDMLSAEEWQRVRRYASSLPGRRFIVRRGLLRRILGGYLNRPPDEVKFVYNAHGKPFLAPELSSDLQFSLSDSGDKAAIAVGLGDPVGIDIEWLRTIRLDRVRISPGTVQREVAFRGNRSAGEHSFEFFQAWTRREALAKAEGVGLQMLSRQSDAYGGEDNAPTDPGARAALDRRVFHLHALTLPAAYVGALATRPKSPKIVYYSA